MKQLLVQAGTLEIVKLVKVEGFGSKLQDFVKIAKFGGQNCETLSKLTNLVKIGKFCQSCKVWSKLENLFKVAKFGQHWEV